MVKMKVNIESYTNHGLMPPPCFWVTVDKDQTPGVRGKPPTMVLIADTGAQVDIVGFDNIHKIGLGQENLLRKNSTRI